MGAKIVKIDNFAASIFLEMSFLEILLIGIGLSMDAFSVSVCKGLTTKKFSWKMALTCGLWFGFFQALMPLIGYFLGEQFEQYITSVDHWIAFGLLFLIGANMIREALVETENGERKTENGERKTENGEEKTFRFPFSVFRSQLQMLPLAIATSIDALAVGISFACIQVKIWSSVLIIGLTTFAFSIVGVKIGNVFGSRFEKGAEIAGGIILILIGLKILLEHLGLISF